MNRYCSFRIGGLAAALAICFIFTGITWAEPSVQYSWNLDSNPGWTMEGEWAFGQPQGLGGEFFGNPDPTTGATGTNVYGINLEGDFSIELGGPYHLMTGAIDCSGLTQVSLHFQRWLNTDWQPWVTAAIEVSADGTTWAEVWNNGFEEIADSAWSEHVYDISAVADGQEAVYIRWSHTVTDSGTWAYSGWNIDDIEIHGEGPSGSVAATLACAPESGQLPFTVSFQAGLINTTTEHRRVAGRIDVTTGGGSQIAGWRSGYTNLTPGELFSASWSQSLPAVAILEGLNVFILVAEDVTPAPYNQPPYLPSGDSHTAQCTVDATAP